MGNVPLGRLVDSSVALLFFMSIPGLAVMLVALAALDRTMFWLRGRRGLPWFGDNGRPVSAAGFDQLHATFQPSKAHATERRAAELMLRDEEQSGAPPVVVDLDARKIIVFR